MSQVRVQGIGLVVLATCSVLLVMLMTLPSNARLRKAQAADAQLEIDEAELAARLQVFEAAKSLQGTVPSELIWSGPDDASVEIAQQQALVDLANSVGLQVVSFGVSQGPENISHPTKAYEIEVQGGHGELGKLLAGIDDIKPRLAVSYLWLRQIPLTEGETEAPINARLTVWGFRDGQAVQQ
jgi:hypothetical protein